MGMKKLSRNQGPVDSSFRKHSNASTHSGITDTPELQRSYLFFFRKAGYLGVQSMENPSSSTFLDITHLDLIDNAFEEGLLGMVYHQIFNQTDCSIFTTRCKTQRDLY